VSIFAATETEFLLIFGSNTNIGFIDEIYATRNTAELDKVFAKIWERPIKKNKVKGIHGTIFYELSSKKIYYPSRRDEEAINPDGSALR
jgi:hypothetical protein